MRAASRAVGTDGRTVGRYILRRLLWVVFVLMVVTLFTYFVFFVMPPGDPLIAAFFVTVMNLIVDIIYAFLDPRVRYT
jgi:ABC-type dipeptide/oligopeptide/nickel transport system permease component